MSFLGGELGVLFNIAWSLASLIADVWERPTMESSNDPTGSKKQDRIAEEEWGVGCF